jgi:hypothetical protein
LHIPVSLAALDPESHDFRPALHPESETAGWMRRYVLNCQMGRRDYGEWRMNLDADGNGVLPCEKLRALRRIASHHQGGFRTMAGFGVLNFTGNYPGSRERDRKEASEEHRKWLNGNREFWPAD